MCPFGTISILVAVAAAGDVDNVGNTFPSTVPHVSKFVPPRSIAIVDSNVPSREDRSPLQRCHFCGRG